MSITAVSAISSYGQDAMQQQSGMRQDVLRLQQALSSGNVAAAQQALSHFEERLQTAQPQQNGIRASAELNPASTMRTDMQALQSALDSGDLAMAEESLARVLQDSQKINATPAGLNGQTASALPKVSEGEDGLGLSAGLSKTNGNLIDVSA
jgi:peptidoglycan hydrolase CwlO-like protein